MLKRLALSALVSAAVLATAAFSPASAGHWGGRGGGGGGGHHFGGGHFAHFNRGGHPGGFRYFHRGGHPGHFAFHRPGRFEGHRPWRFAHWHNWHNRHHCHGYHCRWRYGFDGWGYYDEGPGYDGGYNPVTYGATGQAPTCNCLGKDYLEDGTVRFFDRCTNESAVGAPEQNETGGQYGQYRK